MKKIITIVAIVGCMLVVFGFMSRTETNISTTSETSKPATKEGHQETNDNRW